MRSGFPDINTPPSPKLHLPSKPSKPQKTHNVSEYTKNEEQDTVPQWRWPCIILSDRLSQNFIQSN